MSMHVHNGVRFTSTDLLEIHHGIMNWRVRIKELTVAAQAKFLADHVTLKIDLASAKGKAIKHPLSSAWSVMMDRQDEIKKTQRRDPLVDFEFTCSILPFEGRVYGIVFCEQDEWVSEFKSLEWVEEFEYQNSTDDIPDGVSEDEWQHRADIWDRIFVNNSAASQCGFTAECTAMYEHVNTKDVLPLVKPFDKRLESVAKELVVAEYARELAAGAAKDDTSWIWTAMRYPSTEEGKEKLAIEIERIRPLLHPTLTSEILLG